MKTKFTIKDLPRDYKDLIVFHMLRPIHDRVEYENALEITDAMAGHSLSADQEDYFEALCLLIAAYESSPESLPSKRGLPLLKHLVEENNLSAADISRLLGVDRSLGVRILNGERNLTVGHAKKLGIRFHLPMEVFLA